MLITKLRNWTKNLDSTVENPEQAVDDNGKIVSTIKIGEACDYISIGSFLNLFDNIDGDHIKVDIHDIKI